MAHAPHRPATLGDVLLGGYKMQAYCQRCQHFATVDVRAIAQRKGMGFPVDARMPLVCSQCGNPHPKITIERRR